MAVRTILLNPTYSSRQARWYVFIAQPSWTAYSEFSVTRTLMRFFCDYVDEINLLYFQRNMFMSSLLCSLDLRDLNWGWIQNHFPRETLVSLASMSVDQLRKQCDALFQLLVFHSEMSMLQSFISYWQSKPSSRSVCYPKQSGEKNDIQRSFTAHTNHLYY